MPLSIHARPRTPPAARNDPPAIGKLRPWTQQKAEAERRVNTRKNHRAGEIKTKKLEQDKVHAQSPADRRSDPKVRQAEKETTAQLGKVFAAFSMSAPKTADGLCKDLPKLLKPATDRNYRPLGTAGVSTQDQLNASEERYQGWIEDLATQSLMKMTDAELQSVAKGLDGTHFSSDAVEVFVISKAIAKECERRRPQPEAARKACTKLGEGRLSDALSEMKTARGGRDNPLDWKTAMVHAELEDSQLLAILEKFRPEKGGYESQATQLLGSLNHIAKGAHGNEHPQARQAGNDMAAIVTAARELLGPERRPKLDYLAGVVNYTKQAPRSEDENVRAALRDGLGIEIGEANKPIAVHGAAQAGVNPEILQARVARQDAARAGAAPKARPADESPNMGVAKVLTKQAARELLGLRESYTDAQFKAAKDAALRRWQLDSTKLNEIYQAFDTLEPPRPPVPRARPAGAGDVQPNPQNVADNGRVIEGQRGDVRPARRFNFSDFEANVVLNEANNPIYGALKSQAREEYNEGNFEFLEQATKYQNGMDEEQLAEFGRNMDEFVDSLNLKYETRQALVAAMGRQRNGFDAALSAAVEEVKADVMANTFRTFLKGMADGTVKLTPDEVETARRYLESVARQPAVQAEEAPLRMHV